MFGIKKNHKKSGDILSPKVLDTINIDENTSKAKIKEYNAILSQMQEQLLAMETELKEKEERLGERNNALPVKEQKVTELEAKRQEERTFWKRNFVPEQERLQQMLKRFRGKRRKHKILGILLLVLVVVGAFAYTVGVYRPMVGAVADQQSIYESEYQSFADRQELDLEAELAAQKEIWEAEILALEKEKQLLEDEVKAKLQQEK